MLDGLIDEYESTLRTSYGSRSLPGEWEDALAAIDRSTPLGKLRAWKLLAVYTELRRRELAASNDPGAASDAARQLLRREPVRVTLPNRTVEVTGRSLSAMTEISMHDLRRQELQEDSRRAAALQAATLGTLAKRPALRRRYRRLSAIHRRILVEIELHRQAIYAHAFTPDGAPARSLDDAPTWWRELDQADDSRVLVALLEAGPGRYARLGTAQPTRADAAGGEDFGWSSLLASIERQQRIPAAELYDRDLWQQLTWLRAGAPPVPEGMGA